MNKVIELPYSKLIGIELSENAEYLTEIKFNKDFRNHLNTFHASVIYSFAEISSGVFLKKIQNADALQSNIVLRNSSVKYKALTNSKMYAKVKVKDKTLNQLIEEIKTKNRLQIQLQVDVFDKNKVKVFQGVFEWFFTKSKNFSEN